MDAPALLRAFLERKKLSPADFSRSTGISQAHLSRYLNRERRPGLDNAEIIEEATRRAVPAKAWAKRARRPTAA